MPGQKKKLNSESPHSETATCRKFHRPCPSLWPRSGDPHGKLEALIYQSHQTQRMQRAHERGREGKPSRPLKVAANPSAHACNYTMGGRPTTSSKNQLALRSRWLQPCRHEGSLRLCVPHCAFPKELAVESVHLRTGHPCTMTLHIVAPVCRVAGERRPSLLIRRAGPSTEKPTGQQGAAVVGGQPEVTPLCSA